MPTTWTAQISDDFNRADTSPGAAGTTAGVGNGWIDKIGGVWSILNNMAHAVPSPASAPFQKQHLLRPVSEAGIDQRISARLNVLQADARWLIFRSQAPNNSGFSALYFVGVAGYQVYIFAASATDTGLVVGATPEYTSEPLPMSSNVEYELDFNVVGVDPTRISGSIKDLSNNSTIFSLSNLEDSAPQLQFAGQAAIGFNNEAPATANFNSVTVYSGTETGTETGENGGSSPASFSVDNANLFFSPYNWRKSGAAWAQTNNPGAYFKTAFSGTSFKLNVDLSTFIGASAPANAYPRLVYSVDGGPWTYLQLTAGNASPTLASGLAAGTHFILIALGGITYDFDRWNAPVAILRVTGVTLDAGATLSMPPILPGRMVVVGDSVSEGHEQLGLLATVTNQDATQAAPWLIASALGCEVGVVAFAGHAYTHGTGNVPALPASWDKYSATQSRLVGGLLSPAPDFLVSLMGENDGGDVTATIAGLIPDWRTAAGAAARIVIGSPADNTHAAQITAAVAASNDSKALAAITGEDLLGAKTGALQWSNNNHLNVRGAARYAANLTRKIQLGIAPSSGETGNGGGGEIDLQAVLDAIALLPSTAALRGDGDLIFDPLVTGENDVPLSGAAISLRRFNSSGVAESATFLRGVTGSDGRVRFGEVPGFALEARRYLALVRADGYLPTAPLEFELEEDFAPTWELVPRPAGVAPGDPVPGQVEVVFNGVPFGFSGAGVVVKLEIPKTVTLIGGRFLTDRIKRVETDANCEARFWAWPASQLGGAVQVLTAHRLDEKAAFTRQVLVPDTVPTGGGDLATM